MGSHKPRAEMPGRTDPLAALSPHPPVTVSIGFVRGLLSGTAQPPDAIAAALGDAGISGEMLALPAARVTAAQYAALFRSLCQSMDDECIGFLSRPFKRGSYALMAQSALHAQDLHGAVLRLVPMFRVLQDDMSLELLGDGALAGLGLRFVRPEAGDSPFLHEFMLRSLWRLFDWLVGGDLAIARFDFALPAPADADRYSEFFNGPTSFGAPTSAFWFDQHQLQAPIRVGEAALTHFLTDPQTRFIVPRRREDELSERVLAHLHNARPAWPDLDATSDALCMSAASLQRNLAREGTSFQILKDRLRRDMAITYLNTTSMSLAELAYKLGFSESAGFQRAFKAWTGTAPGTYRRAQS